MKINEAIKKAGNLPISRESWKSMALSEKPALLNIEGGLETCLIASPLGWRLSSEDISADDWTLSFKRSSQFTGDNPAKHKEVSSVPKQTTRASVIEQSVKLYFKLKSNLTDEQIRKVAKILLAMAS